jgi:hypothetical protein
MFTRWLIAFAPSTRKAALGKAEIGKAEITSQKLKAPNQMLKN